MKVYSSPHSFFTPSPGLRRVFHVHNFEFINKISWVGCSWMLSCKDKVTMAKWSEPAVLLCLLLTQGNSEPRAPKLKQGSKIELNQVQAAARVNPTDSHSSKPEITWWVICCYVKLVICVSLQSAQRDFGTNSCLMLHIAWKFVAFTELAIQWWKGICKRGGRAGTLNSGSMGKLLCRATQCLTCCSSSLDLWEEGVVWLFR